MKIIVTHSSPDMDAITSVWLIRKFLPGWENAIVRFVPAGERFEGSPHPLNDSSRPSGNTQWVNENAPISTAASKSNRDYKETVKSSFRGGTRPSVEILDGHEVIHVDTGLGPLDHHQTASDKVCAASLTWEYVKIQNSEFRIQNSKKIKDRMEAISRVVRVVVDIDHFKEVFWEDATADYHEFSAASLLDGLKLQKPNQDEFYVEFISDCLDAILHEFENRIWAEEEIKNNGAKFNTRYGKGIGFETINDSVIKLAQKMGYVIVVRKDPRKGYVRIKALPALRSLRAEDLREIDLTLAYEKLKKMDPRATWFLHVGRKMLLNGSVKNPKMKPTRLGLSDMIKVLERI